MSLDRTIRNISKAAFALTALSVVSACADKASAPSAHVAINAPANFSLTGTSVVFRVNNAEGAVQRIGAHLISIPANAICDLATSGYGATYWDQPCAPQAGSIIITATVFEDADGQPYVDFQPSMRFSPDKEVMLFARQGRNSGKRQLGMMWCNNLGTCTDESLTDSSLKPFRIGNTPVIGRRLKHFSGYLVYQESDCSGTVYSNGDGTYWCEEGGFSRRSGYMVASGKDVSDILNDKDQDKSGEKDEQ